LTGIRCWSSISLKEAIFIKEFMLASSEQKRRKKPKPNLRFSLSDFLPPGTVYFYSFPVGEDSRFYNCTIPWKEELIGARPLMCAGDKINVITFSSTIEKETWKMFTEKINAATIDHNQIIPLPDEITAGVNDSKRNRLVKAALKMFNHQGRLIMTQPYLNKHLFDMYQISPKLSNKLNDKINQPLYIPKKYLPVRYKRFSNGKKLFAYKGLIPLPCVVKVSSSTSGDGVRICKDIGSLKAAQKDFKRIRGSVLVEEFITAAHNLGIQFGIPYDSEKPIEIIGFNEQLTSEQGDYLGGIVNPKKKIKSLKKIYKLLENTVLPEVRRWGWHGVGGVDVLVHNDGKFYFIDPNFRMTAAFVYIYLARNKLAETPLVSFTGLYKGSKYLFEKNIVPIAKENLKNQRIKIIALTRYRGAYRFNAGMFFKEAADLKKNAKKLLKIGIQSDVLEQLARSDFEYEV